MPSVPGYMNSNKGGAPKGSPNFRTTESKTSGGSQQATESRTSGGKQTKTDSRTSGGNQTTGGQNPTGGSPSRK